MSGSPKVAEIRMQEAEARRLAAERRRKAEEERRRRIEAERRALSALISQLRSALQDESERVGAALVALRLEAHAGGSSAVPYVEPQLQAAAGASSSDDPEVLARSLGTVRAIAARVAALREAFGREAGALTSAREILRREADAEAQRLLDAARSQAAALHSVAVQVSTRLRARVAGIEADEIAMAWSADAIQAVKTALERVGGARDPEAVARELEERLDAALEHAQERQLAEEKRAYIVAALADGLREQGFHVGDLVLVGPDASGEVAFRAVRADRRRVDVNVPLEGHVFYEVDGTDHVVERGADGLTYTGCDETEARLEALHADLAARFGIETGELFWESKDPNRERRTANVLPSGGPSASRKQG